MEREGLCSAQQKATSKVFSYYEREINLRRAAPTRPKIPVLSNASVEGSGVCPVMMEGYKSQRESVTEVVQEPTFTLFPALAFLQWPRFNPASFTSFFRNRSR